jgi:hypothetical protein
MASVNMSLTQIRREMKNIMGESVPNYEKKSIGEFVDRFLSKANLSPQYQREPAWSQETSNGLISSIYHNSIVPGFIAYKLHSGDEGYGKYRCEMIDGQNRARAINAFVKGQTIQIPGKKPYHVFLEYKNPDGTKQYVFYSEETGAGREWEDLNPGKKAEYFTEDEKDTFDEYCIEIRILTKQLTYKERATMFLSLQNGKPVRNSDLDKNQLDCGVITFFRENNFESLIKTKFMKYCTRRMTKYWTRWGVRLILIFLSVRKVKNEFRIEPDYVDSDDDFELCDSDSEEDEDEDEEDEEVEDEEEESGLPMSVKNTLAVQKFLFGDTKIGKMIMDCSPSLELTVAEKVEFQQAFAKFADFLEKSATLTENPNFKLNPTQLYTLFYHLTFNTYSESALLSHMKFWSTDGRLKVNRVIWESSLVETRQHYFDSCLTQLSNYVTEAAEPTRKRITEKLKKEVWTKTYGKAKEALCRCGTTITLKISECGHIVSHAREGETVAENLRPICSKCNKSMGTQNMDEYFDSEYPVEK